MELGSQEFWDRLATEPERVAVEVCTIDIADLVGALQRHAALRAWVNAAHEKARVEESRAEWEFTKAKAVAMIHARGSLDPLTKKAKSVAVMEAEVDCDSQVSDAKDTVLHANTKRGALRAMSDALEDRKDMLVQIAARARMEQRDYGGA